MIIDGTPSFAFNPWGSPINKDNSTVLPLNISGRLNDSVIVFHNTSEGIDFPLDDLANEPGDAFGLICIIIVIIIVIFVCSVATTGTGGIPD